MFLFSSLPSTSSLNPFNTTKPEHKLTSNPQEELKSTITSVPADLPTLDELDDYYEISDAPEAINDEDFYEMGCTTNEKIKALPIETRMLSQYVDVPNESLHIDKSCNNTLTKQKIKKDGTSSKYIFKQINASPEIAIDSPMYEIEAFMADAFRLLIPGKVPKEHAICNDDTGAIEFIAIKVIEGLATFKKLNPTEEDLNAILADEKKVEALISAIFASIYYRDDDAHRGNLTPDGIRIDFDMALWTIVWLFKRSNILELLLKNRRPTQGMPYTAPDIRVFPGFADDDTRKNPVYSPGRDLKDNYLKIACAFASSQNPYTPVEQAFFKKLSNPIYKKYLYKRILKALLYDREHYRKIATCHIRPTIYVKATEKSLIDTMADELGSNVESLRHEVLNMHEFHQFLTEYGETAIKELKEEIALTNAQFLKRATRAKDKRGDNRYFENDTRMSEQEVDKRYADIVKAAQDMHEEYVKEGENEAVLVPQDDPEAEQQYSDLLAQSFYQVPAEADQAYQHSANCQNSI